MPPEKEIKFFAEIQTETKVADEIFIGMELELLTLFGRRIFTVFEVNRKFESATARSGKMLAPLKLKEDGWYDQHININEDCLDKIKFY
jgi:hypothetical protein